MTHRRLYLFLSPFYFTFLTSSFAADLDAILDALAPREKSPRLLNTVDIQLKSSTPQPLMAVSGDFNNDGREDQALSGVYILPGQGPGYFLLVGSQRQTPFKYERLFFREYPQPVYLYAKGMTGEGDPNNQAFSISFCQECDRGFDFYWNREKASFDSIPWKTKIKRLTKMETKEAPQVPMDQVDAALKIVGSLKDVNDFVAKTKKEGKELKTRVEPLAEFPNGEVVLVKLFSVKAGRESLYDAIQVNLQTSSVLKRKKMRSLK